MRHGFSRICWENNCGEIVYNCCICGAFLTMDHGKGYIWRKSPLRQFTIISGSSRRLIGGDCIECWQLARREMELRPIMRGRNRRLSLNQIRNPTCAGSKSMGRSMPAAGLRSTEIGSSLRAERKEKLQAQPEP